MPGCVNMTTTLLCAVALLMLGGPHACARIGAVHPSATELICSSPNSSAAQLRACEEAADARTEVTTGVNDGIVRVTPSLALAFPERQRFHHRNLLVRRERRARRTKGDSGTPDNDSGSDAGGDQSNSGSDDGSGDNQEPPSDPPSETSEDSPFPQLGDFLNNQGGGDDTGNSGGDNGDGGGDGDAFKGGEGQTTLSGGDDGGGENGGQDVFFSEDEFPSVDDAEGPGQADAPIEEPQQGGDSAQGEFLDGDGDSADAPSPSGQGSSTQIPSFDEGGAPRSGNGKAFEQCPSDGKWNVKDWNLEELIGKNFLFFEMQESGELPAGHRVKWRGNSYLNDKHKDRLLNYGWFDAGDHLKLMFPMGWTVATIAWGIIDGQEYLSSQQFDGKSNLQWAVQTLEYGLEFLLDCSFDNGEFVAQIGETDIDHYHVFKAEKDNTTPRTEFVTLPPATPGSDLLYQAAAAYAAGAIALRKAGGNGQLASRAEQQAKAVYKQGDANPGIYSDSIPEVGLTYVSNNWQQYGFWAAAWLYRLTGDAMYKTAADEYYTSAGGNGKDMWADFSWTSVYMGAAAVMWQETGEEQYEKKMAMFAKNQINADGNIHHTPQGLMYMAEWGPLRYAAGGAGMMAKYARGLSGATSSNGIAKEEILAFAEHQLAYILGATGHSYVAGYGCNPPKNPHHRNACLTMEESDQQDVFDNKEFNEYELTGALVGGPDINDGWNDDRKDYKRTEVAIDYNAAMFWAAVQLGM